MTIDEEKNSEATDEEKKGKAAGTASGMDAGETAAADNTAARDKRPPAPEQMTEAELRAEFEKHFREQKVDEMLVQFLVTLSNLAFVKMGLTEDTRETRDLAQASLAIDAFKSLLEAAEKRLPEQDAKALAGALSSMQMTYVKVGAEGAAPTETGDQGKREAGEQGKSATGEQGKRETGAKGSPETGDQKKHKGDDPASRLWVPGK